MAVSDVSLGELATGELSAGVACACGAVVSAVAWLGAVAADGDDEFAYHIQPIMMIITTIAIPIHIFADFDIYFEV